jgi:hypothetical protein
MKNILSFCAAIIISLLYACNQPAGESKAGDIQAKGLSTEPAGTYMKATINVAYINPPREINALLVKKMQPTSAPTMIISVPRRAK